MEKIIKTLLKYIKENPNTDIKHVHIQEDSYRKNDSTPANYYID